MDTNQPTLLAMLGRVDLEPSIYTPMFSCHIDMVATAQLHPEAFADMLEYMQVHIEKYCIVFPDCECRWVPLDYIKYIYKSDTNFRFRLTRFLKGLTRRDYREEADEDVMDLSYGFLGNQFLSWDMTMCLFLQEGRGNLSSTKKGKEKLEEATFVAEHEGEDKEEILSEAQEASMALVMLQGGEHVEDLEGTIEGDDVLDALPGFDVERLLPIVVDGVEFLFLDDICKVMGFREDEALSALAQMVNVEAELSTQPPTRTKVDVQQDPLTSEADYIYQKGVRSVEESVAAALIAIKSAEEEYNLVPESAFLPPKKMEVHHADAKRLGSINIAGPQTVKNDDESSTAIQVDQFASRKGGARASSSGRDSSMWHYIPCFNSQVMRIIHLDYSTEAVAELTKCKALSASLCEDPLTMNANKCILVNREAARLTFGGTYSGDVLPTCAMALAIGENDPTKIVERVGKGHVCNERIEAIRAFLNNM